MHTSNGKPSPSTDQFYKEVGIRIREARKKADNMTQEALALSVGLTRTSLTNIEKGRQKVLLHTFTQIASALGTEPGALLPAPANVLDGIGVNLPSSLAPEVRGFIERAIGSGAAYETQQSKSDQVESQRASSTVRSGRGTSRRGKNSG
ncbi:MAG: helix-turn-helix transcriptional regulator [Verrucomicrobiales bacterium]|nr:helix-turn-helix transcriptional regulator [Verrucomicrobiales bacterium]